MNNNKNNNNDKLTRTNRKLKRLKKDNDNIKH